MIGGQVFNLDIAPEAVLAKKQDLTPLCEMLF
jgi:hypothetical protein